MADRTARGWVRGLDPSWVAGALSIEMKEKAQRREGMRGQVWGNAETPPDPLRALGENLPKGEAEGVACLMLLLINPPLTDSTMSDEMDAWTTTGPGPARAGQLP